MGRVKIFLIPWRANRESCWNSTAVTPRLFKWCFRGELASRQVRILPYHQRVRGSKGGISNSGAFVWRYEKSTRQRRGIERIAKTKKITPLRRKWRKRVGLRAKGSRRRMIEGKYRQSHKFQWTSRLDGEDQIQSGPTSFFSSSFPFSFPFIFPFIFILTLPFIIFFVGIVNFFSFDANSLYTCYSLSLVTWCFTPVANFLRALNKQIVKIQSDSLFLSLSFPASLSFLKATKENLDPTEERVRNTSLRRRWVRYFCAAFSFRCYVELHASLNRKTLKRTTFYHYPQPPILSSFNPAPISACYSPSFSFLLHAFSSSELESSNPAAFLRFAPDLICIKPTAVLNAGKKKYV